jgi:hypothetical protein
MFVRDRTHNYPRSCSISANNTIKGIPTVKAGTPSNGKESSHRKVLRVAECRTALHVGKLEPVRVVWLSPLFHGTEMHRHRFELRSCCRRKQRQVTQRSCDDHVESYDEVPTGTISKTLDMPFNERYQPSREVSSGNNVINKRKMTRKCTATLRLSQVFARMVPEAFRSDSSKIIARVRPWSIPTALHAWAPSAIQSLIALPHHAWNTLARNNKSLSIVRVSKLSWC